jgi:uncharacterized integral membrane protein
LKYIAWLLKAVIFFVLFAFALNNQAAVELHFFFGNTWQAPLVLVVLVAFGTGLFAGIAVMLPIWLRGRRKLAALKPSSVANDAPAPTQTLHHGH